MDWKKLVNWQHFDELSGDNKGKKLEFQNLQRNEEIFKQQERIQQQQQQIQQEGQKAQNWLNLPWYRKPLARETYQRVGGEIADAAKNVAPDLGQVMRGLASPEPKLIGQRFLGVLKAFNTVARVAKRTSFLPSVRNKPISGLEKSEAFVQRKSGTDLASKTALLAGENLPWLAIPAGEEIKLGSKLTTVLANLTKNAVMGAGFTAAQPFSEGKNLKEVAKSARTGAIIGTAGYGLGKGLEGLIGLSGKLSETAAARAAFKNSVKIEKNLTGTPITQKYGIIPMREIGKRHPSAGIITASGREATSFFENKRNLGFEKAEQSFRGLKPNEQKLTVDLQEKGIKDLSNQPKKIQKAVEGIRWFNAEIKKSAKNMGIDTSKWGYEEENYFHHLFTGDQTVIVNNKIVGIGKMSEAQKIVENYIKNHPNVSTTDILIKPKINIPQKTTTLLSQKGFWTFVNKMADKLAVTPNELITEMQGVAGIKPSKKFVGAFLERKANLKGYSTNPELVYKSLWNRISRKEAFDPFTKKATAELSKIPQAELRTEMEAYIKRVSGTYKEPTTLLGINIDKPIAAINKAETFLKLGYRPASAALDRLGPLQTAYPIIGNDLFKGEAMRYTKAGQDLIKKVGVRSQKAGFFTGTGGEYKSTTGTVNKLKDIFGPMKMFSSEEQATREATLLGGYSFAKDKLKFNEAKALDWGKELVNSTQYLYHAADLPRIYDSPLGHLVGKFKVFPINYLYNAKNILTGQELGGLERFGIKLTPAAKIQRAIRFFGANFAVGGLRTITQLAAPVPIGLLSYMAIKHPRVFQGALSYAGIDLSKRAGASPSDIIPQDAADLFGPIAGDVNRLYKAIKNKDYTEAIRINSQAWSVYQALSYEPESAIQPTTGERVLTGLGFEPSRLSRIREAQTYAKQIRPDMRTKIWRLPTKRGLSALEKYQSTNVKRQDIRDILKGLLK